ncbi:lysosomal cholesterol signaling protein-like [Tachypleus tridentatus]|uniref:lysosomal cholesterol signaling protein-like n=1 Tax=Tachypleus tridentatus TaxID=6853 RepID=UPI003FD2DDCD
MRPQITVLSNIFQIPPSGVSLQWCKVLPANSNTTSKNDSETAFEYFVPTLLQCFVVILCGYLAGRTRIMMPSQAIGLNTFVTYFSLPAVIILSIATINLESVHWNLLGGLMLSKVIIFISVAVGTLLLCKPTNLAMAGLYAIFCTQCNDLGIGIPIVSALYAITQPMFSRYMYLLTPLTLALLNPVSFILMEVEKIRQYNKQEASASDDDKKEKSTQSTQSSTFLHHVKHLFKLSWVVALGIIKNPVIIATVLGIILNFSFQSQLPDIIYVILKVLASTFSGSVLFLLGISMVGKLVLLRGKSLFLPGMLFIVKMIASPFINHALVEATVDEGNNSQIFLDFSLLYGVIPPGTSVLLFANQYGLPTDAISCTMVISTFLSFLMAFLVAKTSFLKVSTLIQYAAELKNTMFYVGLFTTLACIWVGVYFLYIRRWKRMPYPAAMCLAVAQAILAFGILLWSLVNEETKWIMYINWFLVTNGQFSSRLWTVILAFVLVLVAQHKSDQAFKFLRSMLVVGFGIPLVVVVCLIIEIILNNRSTYDHSLPLFLYGGTEVILNVVVLTICFLTTIALVVLYHRKLQMSKNEDVHSRDNLQHETDKNPIKKENESVYKIQLKIHSSRRPSLVVRRTETSISLKDLLSVAEGSDLDFTDLGDGFDGELGEIPRTFQELRYEILLIVLCVSMAISLVVNIWKMRSVEPSGSRMGMEFVEAVMNCGQGFYLFIIFGLDVRTLSASLVKSWRNLRYGKETPVLPPVDELDQETCHVCYQFVTYHFDSVIQQLPKDITWKNRTFKSVFTGKQLVNWLIKAGLAHSSYEAEEYGQKLLNGRVIRHIQDAHYFYDSPFLYEFIPQEHEH